MPDESDVRGRTITSGEECCRCKHLIPGGTTYIKRPGLGILCLSCVQVESDAAKHPPTITGQISDTQVGYMVQRFLSWSLPEGFHPDGGISFVPTIHRPVGTNLFNFPQAEAMVRHMIDGLPLEHSATIRNNNCPGCGKLMDPREQQERICRTCTRSLFDMRQFAKAGVDEPHRVPTALLLPVQELRETAIRRASAIIAYLVDPKITTDNKPVGALPSISDLLGALGAVMAAAETADLMIDKISARGA